MADKIDGELKAMEAVYASLRNLQPEEQSRVLSWVQQKIGIQSAVGQGAPISSAGAAVLPSDHKALTPKAFLAEKKPKTDVERVVCLAYYLTHSRETEKYKTKNLTTLNTEAAQPPFSNAAFAVTNATNGKYLAPAGAGQKQITVKGESVVEALPDREKVKATLEANPLGHRKRSRSSAKRRK